MRLCICVNMINIYICIYIYMYICRNRMSLSIAFSRSSAELKASTYIYIYIFICFSRKIRKIYHVTRTYDYIYIYTIVNIGLCKVIPTDHLHQGATSCKASCHCCGPASSPWKVKSKGDAEMHWLPSLRKVEVSLEKMIVYI